MAKNFLIVALENEIIRFVDNGTPKIEMLAQEYEKELLKVGFDAKTKIYRTKGGAYKTKQPIQICIKDRVQVLKRLYEYYYGPHTYTLDYCFNQSIAAFSRSVARKQRSEVTVDIYKSNWKRFFQDYPIAEKPIVKIRASELYEHLEQLVFDHQLSRQGLNDAKTIANRAFAWAGNNDVIEVNVADSVKTDGIICRDIDNSGLVYTDEERDALLKVMEESDHVAGKALALMFCLCVRSGEIRALKWEDVDFRKRKVYIHAQIVRGFRGEDGKRGDIYKGITKNKVAEGNRLVILSDRALGILEKQRKENPHGVFVFEYDGHFLKPNMLNTNLKKYCQKAKVGYMPTHKIRFWSVTAMNNADVPSATMQYMAGHKDPQTTDRYKRVARLEGIDLETANQIYS